MHAVQMCKDCLHGRVAIVLGRNIPDTVPRIGFTPSFLVIGFISSEAKYAVGY